MKRKALSQVLGDVDPDLTIIPGGTRHYRRRKRGVRLNEVPGAEMSPYTPQHMTLDDWNDCPGVICPRCHQEVEQLIPLGMSGRVKLCKQCLERKRRLIEHKRRLIDLRRGAELARLKARRLIT